MESFLPASDSSISGYEYVEVQNTDARNDELMPPIESVDVGFGELFTALVIPLIIPLLLLSALVWLLNKQRKVVRDSLTVASENTEAIKLNNELLRENIQLQRELLEMMQKNAR
jgi:hypothetical protein